MLNEIKLKNHPSESPMDRALAEVPKNARIFS